MYVYYKIGTRSFRYAHLRFYDAKVHQKSEFTKRKEIFFLYRRSYVIVLGFSNPYFIS